VTRPEGVHPGRSSPDFQGSVLHILVFFDQYAPFHDVKDGNLLRALRSAGGHPTLVTLAKSELDTYEAPCDVVQADPRAVEDSAFWASQRAGAVLAYTWLSPRYTRALHAMAKAGKRILIKADSDGRIGPPTPPHWYRRSPPWTPEGATNLARRVGWRIGPRWMARRRLEHIAAADVVALESRAALANVSSFVARWGRGELSHRLAHVPIVVPDRFVTAGLGAKERTVVCVARWEDAWTKNTVATVETLAAFLDRRPDYSAIMIGTGSEVAARALARLGKDAGSRLRLAGVCSRARVVEEFRVGQIFFMASRYEGFPLSVGEALTMGCSIAGTPIEALRDVVEGGAYGTLASSFEGPDLTRVLLSEAERWDAGERRPLDIAREWRSRLAPARVGARILSLANPTPESEPTLPRDAPVDP
jgi:glycosyltransferase involved in cell wall biosynthesis